MSPKTDLYNQDFYAWVQEQAALLKARQFEALDLDNLIEEVESITCQEMRAMACAGYPKSQRTRAA